MSAIRVLVVDDHSMFRRGLVDLLSDEDGVEVVGEAGDGRETLRQVETLRPDVVCMDVNMPEPDGIATTAAVSERWPGTRVLMLTVSEDPETLFRSMAAGASGYVLKTSSPGEIVDNLCRVAQGWVAIAPAVAPLFLQTLGEGREASEDLGRSEGAVTQTVLSRREAQILRFVTRAYTNAEIAAELDLSLETVRSHVRRMLDKLQVHSKREVVQRARELGLIGPDEPRP